MFKIYINNYEALKSCFDCI